jgi:hypothetical protein
VHHISDENNYSYKSYEDSHKKLKKRNWTGIIPLKHRATFVCWLCACRTWFPGHHRLLSQVVESQEVISLWWGFPWSIAHAERFCALSVWWTLITAFRCQEVTVFWHRTSLMFIIVTTWAVLDKIIEIHGIQCTFTCNTGIFISFIALFMQFIWVFSTFLRELS